MSILEEVERRIGGLPVGDPGAMRAYAQRLESEAEGIVARVRSVTGVVEGARYECPAATRLRSGVVETEGRLLGAVSQLQGLAASLLRAANSVEADQQSWYSEFDRVASELEKEL